MDEFLKELNNLNRPITSIEIEAIIEDLATTTKKAQSKQGQCRILQDCQRLWQRFSNYSVKQKIRNTSKSFL